MSHMNKRGSDNAFILYGYAVCRASIDMNYYEYAIRARSAEKKYQMRNDNKKASLYLLANEIFKLKAIEDNQSSRSWHNFALCR
jgi:hypothetical protein